jgi:hypothetical protein
MTKEETRKEILELLARGKITIDEAVLLLEQAPSTAMASAADVAVESPKINVLDENEKQTKIVPDSALEIEEISLPVGKKAAGEPRWLRIQVSALDSGKSKVSVNVPYGMVKWGLGMAQLFAPGEISENLDQFGAILSEAESGLLVDVLDEDSNDHVRIFFE